jgi:hypothetical protein
MTGAPTVTWFRSYDGLPEWRLLGDRHLSMVGERTPEGLHGIKTRELIDHAVRLALESENL